MPSPWCGPGTVVHGGASDDTEAETERTFEFIRQVKKVNPQSEIIIYVYTPLPPDSLPKNARVRPGRGNSRISMAIHSVSVDTGRMDRKAVGLITRVTRTPPG